jgi:hypothetical protein
MHHQDWIYIDINRTTGFIQRDACHTQVDTVIFSEQIDMNCAIYILLLVWTELIQVSDACFLGALSVRRVILRLKKVPRRYF